MTKADLFNVVTDWKKEVDELMKKFKFTSVDVAEKAVGRWLADVRRDRVQLIRQPGKYNVMYYSWLESVTEKDEFIN